MERTFELAAAIQQFKTALEKHLLSQPHVDQQGVDQAVRKIMNLTLQALVQESENLDTQIREVITTFRHITKTKLHEIVSSHQYDDNVTTSLQKIELCLSEALDSSDWSLIEDALNEASHMRGVLHDSSWSDTSIFVWDFED